MTRTQKKNLKAKLKRNARHLETEWLWFMQPMYLRILHAPCGALRTLVRQPPYTGLNRTQKKNFKNQLRKAEFKQRELSHLQGILDF